MTENLPESFCHPQGRIKNATIQIKKAKIFLKGRSAYTCAVLPSLAIWLCGEDDGEAVFVGC